MDDDYYPRIEFDFPFGEPLPSELTQLGVAQVIVCGDASISASMTDGRVFKTKLRPRSHSVLSEVVKSLVLQNHSGGVQ